MSTTTPSTSSIAAAATAGHRHGERRRVFVLVLVCVAQVMLMLDTTIVNVALRSIQRDLHFSQANLTWVINAFLISFGSLLLLAGRLSDLLGRKRVFLIGLGVFTVASVFCGAASSQGFLIAARFVQGVGAAMQASVILAIIVVEFPDAEGRTRAMNAYTFASVAGASLGLLVGGALTQVLSWHWIFFVNIPIGVIVFVFGRVLIRKDEEQHLAADRRIDWLGSVLITVSLMVLVYGIIQVTVHGWGSLQVLGALAIAVSLMLSFVFVELHTVNPIMPLRILRIRTLVGGTITRALIMPGMYSALFLGTLYLQRVHHQRPFQTGLSFLPQTLAVTVLSLGITVRVMRRIGSMPTLRLGMVTNIVGLAILSRITATSSYFPTMFFGMALIGAGVGLVFVPLATIAMSHVAPGEAGLASGMLVLAQQVGGALGLAALGTIATDHTKTLLARHLTTPEALVGGYRLAFIVATATVAAGIVISHLILGRSRRPVAAAEAAAPAS